MAKSCILPRYFLWVPLCLCVLLSFRVLNVDKTRIKQIKTDFSTVEDLRGGPTNRRIDTVNQHLSAKSVSTVSNHLRQIYTAEIGVRETTGRNDGARVADYLHYVDLGEGYAWCAAFVCWAYGQAGIANPRTGWAAALFPKSHVVYERGNPELDGIPQQGDTFGIYFANLKRIAHVGFVDEWQAGNYLITVEGNTNEAASRDGDGVYRKRRLKSQIYKVADFINRKKEGL